MRTLILFAFGLCVQTAFSQTVIRMTVNEASKPCRRMMEQTCLQVQKDGSKEWELFYDPIKGFTFEPGFRYEITVIRTERPEPVPQDLSRYLYTLDKIISKTAMPAAGESAAPVMEYLPAPDFWKLTAMNGKQLNSNELYFETNADGTRIFGKRGCNQFNTTATYNKKRTKITTGVLMGTKMACEGEVMELEQEFTAAFSEKTFKLHLDNNLWTWKRKGKVVFAFEKLAAVQPRMIVDPAPTERTPWDYFNGKNLKVIQLNGTNLTDSKAHFLFDTEHHRFSGSNGCNQVSGVFNSDGVTMVFGQVVSTKMACLDEGVQQTERELMAILHQKDLTVDFAEQVLNIYDASGKLVVMLAVDGK